MFELPLKEVREQVRQTRLGKIMAPAFCSIISVQFNYILQVTDEIQELTLYRNGIPGIK